jgi:hypothetical protein
MRIKASRRFPRQVRALLGQRFERLDHVQRAAFVVVDEKAAVEEQQGCLGVDESQPRRLGKHDSLHDRLGADLAELRDLVAEPCGLVFGCLDHGKIGPSFTTRPAASKMAQVNWVASESASTRPPPVRSGAGW